MDKLVIVAGGITAALGIGFIVAHLTYPVLSDAYMSGGISAIGIGSAMMVWGRKLGQKRDVEQLR